MHRDVTSSRLLVLNQRARRLPHPLLAVALAVVFNVVPLALFVAIATVAVLPDSLLSSALAQSAILAGVYGVYVVQISLWVTYWERRPLVTLGVERSGAVRKLLRGAALGIGAYVLLLLVLALLGMVEVRPTPPSGSGWSIALAAGIALGGWAVQGPAEELLYRGWLLPVIAARTRIEWGIVISSVVFALAHLFGNEFDAMMMGNLLLFGVFFALWGLREGGLWGLFGWHASVNWVSENLIVVGEGTGVGPLATGLVLSFREVGPDILTGGSIGLEASLLTTFVLMIGIATMMRWPHDPAVQRRRRHAVPSDKAR